ncbi:chondroitin proteoglycan-2-like [Pungitius pungitius]|uniref:chondroitin proteoglycan-2-like n=1 Tax=Pungitius pungitius TaxID=134920 RepID=UPI002E167B36
MCKLTLTAALCLIIACLGLPGIEAQYAPQGPCAGKPDGLYPNPSDEHSFFYCVAGQAILKQCAANLVYNPAIKGCDYPKFAFFCVGKRDGQYPNPSDQHSFFYCVAGKAFLRQCPANLVYNSAIKVCAYPNSPVNKANDCYGRKDGQYTNPRDQHSFLSCVAGLTYIMQCPANLVYVEAKNWCDYPNQHYY